MLALVWEVVSHSPVLFPFGRKEIQPSQTVVRKLQKQVAMVSRQSQDPKHLLTMLGWDLDEILGCPWDSSTVSF